MRKLAACILVGIGFLSVRSFAQNTFPATGNVGIGTTSPGATLSIYRTTGGSPMSITMAAGSGNGANVNYTSTADGTNTVVGYWGAEPFVTDIFGGGSYGAYPLVFFTNSNERMRITPGGAVGIGTTSPGSKLEVNGNLKLTSGSGAAITYADGTTQTTAWTGVLCGGDYAESVNVTGDRRNFGPGDVLVIDPDNPDRFLKSAEPYSTAVLGVYSTKPGVLGRHQTGPQSADEVPLAMVGIVSTKVSAENGPIKPGDLLVTASIPGFAMKGTDRNRMLGAVIGKALGTLKSATGVIEVGVTLQ